ncbi:hypothetical protein GO003_021225 [Methylicorpusculum oleiharenae]|jgi:hypothetical protein|uniref:hypothetical protein n=1 Tax=Methylicorpusculum oleiharenae TaxID=1338687 RepID=UPI0013591D0E|nr:hypothetical protein [Methylicorpusculum oleiharenae]MCD2452907.1 hypothetical protein [Methylicorpusculum oleiharenae]
MDAPVMIRTRFGDKTDQDGFFNAALATLIQQPEWCAAVLMPDDVYAGPFCYTALERAIPF